MGNKCEIFGFPGIFLANENNNFSLRSTKVGNFEIEDFNINPINPYNPLSTKGGVEILSLFLGMSYNMPNMLSSKFQSPSIKIGKCAP